MLDIKRPSRHVLFLVYEGEDCTGDDVRVVDPCISGEYTESDIEWAINQLFIFPYRIVGNGSIEILEVTRLGSYIFDE